MYYGDLYRALVWQTAGVSVKHWQRGTPMVYWPANIGYPGTTEHPRRAAYHHRDTPMAIKTPYSVVIGLGQTGRSVVDYLKKQGENVVVMDTREELPEATAVTHTYPDISVYLGSLNETLLCEAKELVVSPGVSIHEAPIMKAAAAGVSIAGDIELLTRATRAPIIGITGTNGKSTVTTLVGEFAQANQPNVSIAGNIGEPVLYHTDADLHVLELSSFQLETTHHLACEVAVLLNVTPDHLDRYPSMQAYRDAKQRIFNHAKAIVVNRDDPMTWPMQPFAGKIIYFALKSPASEDFCLRTIENKTYLCKGMTPIIASDELAIQSRWFLANALASLAVNDLMGWDLKKACDILRHFKGLPHRCQLVATYEGVAWFDDSKATNVGSTEAVLEDLSHRFPGKHILIAGGVGKGMDFTYLRDIVKHTVRHLILIGESTPILHQALAGCTDITEVTDLKAAVQLAHQLAQAGEAVVLAPACASFDMFKDYKARGDAFVKLVKEIGRDAK